MEACDFVGFPAGGQLTMCRHLMRAFGSEAGLVGFASDEETPVGRWVEREFEGTRHRFFAFGRRPAAAERPLIPGRLQAFAQLARHRDAILEAGRPAVFTQSPEALLAVSTWPVASICHRFPGVTNSLSISRYAAARLLAPVYSLALFTALRRAETVLAAADRESIEALEEESGGLLPRGRARHFPTRVDTEVFRPGDKRAARRALGVEERAALFVTAGRTGRLKGWPLLLEALEEARRRKRAELAFVGDGEDGAKLREEVRRRGLEGAVRVTGYVRPETVALWLQAADVYVSGSWAEGWSLSMLEALGCGLPLVTTAVSGSKEMVRAGVNGYVVGSRDAREFAGAMIAALELNAGAVSRGIAERYAASGLRADLEREWGAIRG